MIANSITNKYVLPTLQSYNEDSSCIISNVVPRVIGISISIFSFIDACFYVIYFAGSFIAFSCNQILCQGNALDCIDLMEIASTISSLCLLILTGSAIGLVYPGFFTSSDFPISCTDDTTLTPTIHEKTMRIGDKTFLSHYKTNNRVLVIDTSAGAGHKMAAQAIIDQIKHSDPTIEIHRLDMLNDIMPKHVAGFPVGETMISSWDSAQKQGDIERQRKLFKARWIVDYLFGPTIESKIQRYVQQHGIGLVIDCQPLGTKRIASLLTKMDKSYVKVATDLPTRESEHFFEPIRSLSKEERKHFQLFTSEPLLEDGEHSDFAFWQTHCGATPDTYQDMIHYATFPVRSAFFKDLDDSPVFGFESDEELSLVRDCCKDIVANGRFFSIKFDESSIVETLILGSQTAVQSTLAYVEAMIHNVTTSGDPSKNYYFFVFCGKTKTIQNSLLQKVRDLIVRKKIPSNCKIIPLGFQGAEALASLMQQSDRLIIRSGGLSSMEALTKAKGQILIHSESADSDQLINGVPLWEGGNARYMKQFKQAALIHPSLYTLAAPQLKRSV